MKTKSPTRAKGKPKAAKSKAPRAATVAAETVLVLRTCDKDLKSHEGFQWPANGPVEAPDWEPTASCGHGLHGWKWGHGDWGLKAKGENIKWLVVEVATDSLIDLSGKVKFPRGNVVAVYDAWRLAMAYIWAHRPRVEKPESTATGDSGHASATGDYGHASATGDYGHASATGRSGHASATGYSGHASATGHSGHASATGDSGHASATGDSGHASATGDSGHASATGDYGHASATGDSGHASATGYSGHASATGYSGHASATGDSGHASATGHYGHASATGHSGHASATGHSGHASATGYYGHASATGHYGWGIAGYNGQAKAGHDGIISIIWRANTATRPRLVVGYVGEDGIKPEVFYCIENGKFVEVK